jgi:tripartite-type tricarboxylate transporter receptor subunit TctC
VLPHILAGRLRGLAIVSDSRWPEKPDIPTLRETGYGKEGGESWYGILAPAGMPQPIIDKMAKAIEQALQSPDVLEKLDKGGAKPTYLGPADMRAQVNKESAMFGDIIKRANIQTQ